MSFFCKCKLCLVQKSVVLSLGFHSEFNLLTRSTKSLLLSCKVSSYTLAVCSLLNSYGSVILASYSGKFAITYHYAFMRYKRIHSKDLMNSANKSYFIAIFTLVVFTKLKIIGNYLCFQSSCKEH